MADQNQVRTLSIRQIMDSSDYARGARDFIAANQQMSQSSAIVGTVVTQTQLKISGAADGVSRLVRAYDPAAAAAIKFQSEMVGLNKAIETGKIKADEAARVYAGMVQKFGMVADGAHIAAQGFNALGSVVIDTNAALKQTAASADIAANAAKAAAIANDQVAATLVSWQQKATALRASLDPIGTSQANVTAQVAEFRTMLNLGEISIDQFIQAEERLRLKHEQLIATLSRTPEGDLKAKYEQMAAVAREEQAQDNARTRFDQFMGVGRPISNSASVSSSAFEEQLRAEEELLRRQQELAQLRALQDGQNFTSDLNARFGIGSSSGSARSSASVFEEAAREADLYAQKAATLRATLDPVAASQLRLNSELAEYTLLLERAQISVAEFTQAEALARQRHEQFAASFADGGPGGFDNNAQFRRANLGYQAFDVGQSLALGFNPAMILAQQGPQIAQLYAGQGGIKAALSDAASLASGVARAIGPIGLAFGAAGAAAFAFYELTKRQSKTAEQVIKQEQEAIKRVRDLWGEAADQRSRYGRDSTASASFSLDASITDLTKKLAEQAPGIGLQITTAINTFKPATGLNASEFRETEISKKLQRDFNGLYQDTVQGKETVLTFVRELEEIGKRSDNAGIKSIVAAAVEGLKPFKALAEALQEARLERDRLFNTVGPYGFTLSQGRIDQEDDNKASLYAAQQQAAMDRAEKAYQARLAELRARSPLEKQRAAEALAETEYPAGESDAERQQRVKLAGLQALTAAEHGLALAQEDRERQSSRSLTNAQYELSLLGQSVAERNRLMAMYQAEAAIRDANARNRVRDNEAEIAAAREQAKAIADINAQLSLGKAIEDQGYDVQRLQLEASLIGATAEQRARATAALEAEIRLKQQGVDLSSQAAQGYIAEQQALASARTEIERHNAAAQSLQQVQGDMIDNLMVGTGSLNDRLRSVGQTALQWLQQMSANGVKNWLTGTNLPTLGDLFSGKPMVPGASATSTAMMNVTASVVNLNGGLPGVPGTNGLGSLLGYNPASNTNTAVSRIFPAANQNVPATDVAAYIRQAAIARGIDPNVALRVAQSEGGLTSWNQQSNVINSAGLREQSYGPYQLYMNGGLGNDFQRQTGLDPRLAQNGPASVDFALDNVQRNGWTAFHGAANNGISRWEGINRGIDPQTTSSLNSNLQKLSTTTTQTTNNFTGLGDSTKTLQSSFADFLGGSKLPTAPGSFPPAPQGPGYFPPAPSSGGFNPLSFFTSIFGLFGFADGTEHAPGGWAWAGERGPELINFPRGSRVVPNHKLHGMMAGSGGSNVKVDVDVSMDDNGKLQAYVKKISQSTADDVGRAHAAAAVSAYRSNGLAEDIEYYRGHSFERGG